MKTADEIGRILATAGPTERGAYFGALLVRESGLDTDEVIIVGGRQSRSTLGAESPPATSISLDPANVS